MIPTQSLRAAGIVTAILLSGCRVGPNYARPTAPAPPAYKEAPPPNGNWKQAQPSDAVSRGKWWEVFGDSQLNALEEKVAVSNQTLRAATEQYQQAREQVRVARADYFPTLNIGPGASRQSLSLNRPTATQLSKNTYGDFTIEGQAAWEPDLWGRVRRNVEAQRATAQATAADLANTQLSLQAELAADYFEVRGLDLQKQLLDSTVIEYQRALDLTVGRRNNGLATGSDVAQAETQLESTRAQDIDVAVARAQYEHAIATLTGEPASTFNLAAAPLNLPLPQTPAGVPSQLLERRPDIAASERRVQAANAQIGVAMTAYYPQINLTGTGGVESLALSTLIQGPSTLWAFGGTATQLLVDGGRRHAVTRSAQDAFEAAAANYRESVLNGFQEVEDNLAALRILDSESATQQRAVEAAEKSLSISTIRYKGGVTNYLEVITAQTAQLQNQRTAASITTRQFTASVQLIRALGGGWDASQLPRP
jgi:NodT family efflux transporter outer membrane factor (OMF) lipoprotein